MTKENKLPEIGKRIVERLDIDISDRRGLKHEWMSIDEDIKEQLKDEWVQIIDEEIPEQEPTAENHIPDIRKKVDEVQEAKEALKWQIKNDGWSDDKQHRERLMYFSQNLINALDAQEIAGSKLSKTVTLAGKSDENGAEVAIKKIKRPDIPSTGVIVKDGI
tara:strand:- start:6137 stop:6622 length:486 start_codon:yes stop_codon:yes gene_type:complete